MPKTKANASTTFPPPIESVEFWGMWDRNDVSRLFECFQSKQLPRLQRVTFQQIWHSNSEAQVPDKSLEDLQHGLKLAGTGDVRGPIIDPPCDPSGKQVFGFMVGVNFKKTLFGAPKFICYNVT